ncbi:hypothetical protein DFQ30_006953 [Apophysomyces sp. BC1015]|nr:hypothetical protein DFQ30_006953 [Apophysomyces sp. BC1015]
MDIFLDAKMPPLYPLAYVLVLMGVTAYNLTPPPVTSIENEYSEEEQPMLKSPLLSPEDAYTPME